MFRNQYDSDVTTFSPQGRLYQVEYSMEAVKQGSATVGLKSANHAVLAAFKRRPSPLASYQKKVLQLDAHVGVAFSGLTADAKSLGRWMRLECLQHRYDHDSPLSLSRLSWDLGLKLQLTTQGYNKRPYGVGMLIAGYDDEGPHIIQANPSAEVEPCLAMAIGSRSQSARTYLEKIVDELKTLDDLDLAIKHALRALRDTLPNEVELDNENVSLVIVGKDTDFKVIEGEELNPYLALIEGEERRGGQQHQQQQGEEGQQQDADMAQP